jgi:hypothetical protein
MENEHMCSAAKTVFERVLARFNFEQVYQHMLATGWTWNANGAVPYTPTPVQMRDWVCALFACLETPGWSVCSAGFMVSWGKEERGECIKIAFRPKNYQEDYEYVAR